MSEQAEILDSVTKERRWLFIYISLFLALLALFILITSLIQVEGAPAKREFQKLSNELYQQVMREKKQQGLDWLLIENTLAKGIRLNFDKSKMPSSPLFPPARATLNPRYLPYLKAFSELLKSLSLKEFHRRYRRSIETLDSLGYEVLFTIRVEGHTDSVPLAKTAFYRSNMELSAFRAYQVMQQLQHYTQLPASLFSMAGYGSFQPIMPNSADPRNRRVEVYIVPSLVDKSLKNTETVVKAKQG